MFLRIVIAILGVCLLAGCAQAQPAALETEESKTIYSLGVALSQRLNQFDFSPEEVKLLQAGLSDSLLASDLKVDLNVYGPKIDPFLQARAAAAMDVEKAAGVAFCEKAAKEPGAIKTDSGMIYTEIEPGTGPSPSASETVKLNYHGTLRDGTVFDSSIEGDAEPATFKVDQVIPCFGEAVQRMKVGGKSKLVCPPAVAYGDRGRPPVIRGGATLIFDVELVEILPSATPVQSAP